MRRRPLTFQTVPQTNLEGLNDWWKDPQKQKLDLARQVADLPHVPGQSNINQSAARILNHAEIIGYRSHQITR